jgi:putative acyl-CoA dehydrogenase
MGHPQSGAHVARAAMTYLHSQAEAGTGCPLTMTFAACRPCLQPDLASYWLPKILAPNTTRATSASPQGRRHHRHGHDREAGRHRCARQHHPAYPVGAGGPGQAYELVGHKWFCSAPMCDAFLTLAQTDKGLTCFLLPRHRPDDTRNQFYIQRLKTSSATAPTPPAKWSSVAPWRGWSAKRAGRADHHRDGGHDPLRLHGRLQRLMRQALTQASHHCAHRKVGGRVLSEQPLMQNVLADLALESEAALALSLRMGQALEQLDDPQQAHFARLVTAVGKYWICKRAPAMINEAAECMGGAGYVEDSILPRLYREAPVNSTWEGSGNVQCLDVLRARSRACWMRCSSSWATAMATSAWRRIGNLKGRSWIPATFSTARGN